MTKKELCYEAQRQIMKSLRPTYNGYLLHIIHKSWPDDEIELISAHYTARGVSAVVRLQTDNREYVLEIYPE